jgi:raffinose/stachyose/melibiose transport system substrate-binding protein
VRTAIGRCVGLGLLTALIASASVSAASAEPRKTVSSRDVVTVKFLGLTNYRSGIEAVIKNFEGVTPGVKIQATWTDVFTEGTLLRTSLAAGNAPDVFQTISQVSLLSGLAPLAKGGYLADLTRSPWVKRIPPTAKPLVTVNRKVYGWPLGSIAPVLLQNKQLFASLKLKVPTTFAQLLAQCPIAQAGGVHLVEAISGGGYPISTELEASFIDVRDPTWFQKKAAGSTSFSSSVLWRTMYGRIHDLNSSGCLQPASQATTQDVAAADFAQGKAVFMISTSGAYGQVRALNPALQMAFLPLPGEKVSDRNLAIISSQMLSVNAKSGVQAAARQFVDFVAREKQSRLEATVNGGIAPYDVLKGKFPPLFSGFSQLIKAKKFVGLGFIPIQPNLQVSAAETSGSAAIWSGQQTIDQVLQSIDTAWALGSPNP